MRPLFLIGFMCCGKTTLAMALSQKTGLPQIDLDSYIEEKEGRSVTEIFKAAGEAAFREMERTALREMAGKDGYIISCGGGTPCFHDNIEFMNTVGETVFLDASEDILLKRLLKYQDGRPLVEGKSPEQVKEVIKNGLAVRKPFYMKAKYRWNPDRLDTDNEIRESVENFLKSYSHLLPWRISMQKS